MKHTYVQMPNRPVCQIKVNYIINLSKTLFRIKSSQEVTIDTLQDPGVCLIFFNDETGTYNEVALYVWLS